LQSEALKLSRALPTAVVSLSEMASLGYSEQQSLKMLKRFGKYTQAMLTDMDNALSSAEWAPGLGSVDRSQQTVTSISHSTKGAAGMVCAERVVAASKHLQDASARLADAGCSDEQCCTALASVDVWKLEVKRLQDELASST